MALDYGNSPRATPLSSGANVICQGAFSFLLWIDLATGSVRWEINLRDDFPIDTELPWGYCCSPLITDGCLIVAPRGPDASLLALNPESGNVLWKTPGIAMSHGSLITANLGTANLGTVHLGTVHQILGHDRKTLSGWNLRNGMRIWTIEPLASGDFNVPTPALQTNQNGRKQVFIATKNNGMRLLAFDSNNGTPSDTIATSIKLRVDMSTPMLVGGLIYCVKEFLFFPNASALSETWRIRDHALGDYAATFATSDHVPVVGKGELLLLRTDGSKHILSRSKIFAEDQVLYSHPAIIETRLYIQGENQHKCINLANH
ncbi:PQQ-like beta-propeller repeat protein [Rhodopirellula sp.]|nr:PQQ-like beta-propeller repeat protein [Rhodopirellula sp.]